MQLGPLVFLWFQLIRIPCAFLAGTLFVFPVLGLVYGQSISDSTQPRKYHVDPL